MDSLGCKLKDLRKSHNLTMEQLADKINTKYDTKINKGMLSKWENNLGEPSLENMRVLSNFYNVSLDYLLNIENKQIHIDNTNNKLNFGDKIREARKSKKLTQRQFAELIDAKHNSVSNWENNQNKPDPDTIERICGVLDISPSYLLGTKDKDTSITDKEKELLSYYNQLNDLGKDEAIKRVSELGEIPKYCNVVELPNKKDVKEDRSYLEPFAAHNDYADNEEELALIKEDEKLFDTFD